MGQGEYGHGGGWGERPMVIAAVVIGEGDRDRCEQSERQRQDERGPRPAIGPRASNESQDRYDGAEDDRRQNGEEHRTPGEWPPANVCLIRGVADAPCKDGQTSAHDNPRCEAHGSRQSDPDY